MYKVLIPKAISNSGVEYLRKKGCEVIMGAPASSNDPLLEDCDAILAGAGSKIKYDKAVLDRLRNCKVISNFSAGFEHIDTIYAEQIGIQITNSGTANSNAVAEQTILLMLACAKNYEIMSNAAHKGDFSVRKRVFNTELQGLTLGLIGCGNIGRLVAQKAVHGFGMKVIGYDPRLTEENLPAEIRLVSDCNEIYKTADFISLHVPLTEETRYMVSKDQFDFMKPSAYIINVSRGGIIKEADLIQAVKENKIKGAGLDVFEQEPLPVDSELFQYDNIILSPHSAANTVQALENMELYAAKDIWRVLNGEKPEFPVNHP
ncbi:hydroxyacid dehydrogenase [Clostridium sp. Marseille-P2415]|uniref:hydroxyacid dehydrogenase n=1 Tax=Clostridium sp. Marseille-P2415 TaxID=1805471 RepID=UPI00098860AC|nr:hydroxyacid dehydrogenase [Clostridium sp. Marseille-P2415]